MNFTNTLFFHNLHSIRVFNTWRVEKFLNKCESKNYKRKKNEKILTALAVVLFANMSLGQLKKTVDLAVDKSLM